jgi:hypothetical protein
MSTILERLNAAFPDLPLLFSALPTHELHPDESGGHDMLAAQLTTLANMPTGGLLVLGMSPAPPHAVHGVRHPNAWTAVLRRLAGSLVPAVPIEVEPGQEEGVTILVAQVPASSPTRQSAAPCPPAPQSAPLLKEPSPCRPLPLLEPVADSSPVWFDPQAVRQLGHPNPEDWSSETQARLARSGLLARDGVRLTRAALLVAGLAEHRPDDAAVIVEREGRIEVLDRGWVLIRDSLRAAVSAGGISHTDLIADLVLEVLARTAGHGPRDALFVILSPGLVTIEAPARFTNDKVVTTLLRQGSRWRPGRWRALAASHRLPVTCEQEEHGLIVQVHLDRAEKRSTRRPNRPKQQPVYPSTVAVAPAPPVAEVVAPLAPEWPLAEAPVPVAAPLPRETRQSQVLALLADGRSWSRRELDAQLGWSRSTLRNVLEALVHSGLVRTDASSPRSPHQAYRLLGSPADLQGVDPRTNRDGG